MLRPLTFDDASSVIQILGDDDALRYWAGELVTTTAAATQFIESVLEACQQHRFMQWAVETPAAAMAIGLCKIYDLKASHKVAAIGFTLRRADWGHGIMSDALNALLRFAFEQLHLRRVEAFTHPDNDRALRLLSRQGFVVEGRLREKYMGRGGAQDALALALLKSDWAAR
ncbi:MAG: GNAT family N-acetyltransferase [Deltaproteobacteria bacterium]|nr:GNAT family N-acetyltransferase [Deltaproteobacteria bacterium]